MKTQTPTYRCHTGKCKQDIRCECGGQIASSGTLHPLVDFGMGFVGRKFEVKRVYGKRVIGYVGFCMKCQKEGKFLLPGERDLNAELNAALPLAANH